jgi:hypothetical protein
MVEPRGLQQELTNANTVERTLKNMKSPSTSKIIGTLLLMVCCFANINALAHAPQARVAHAVIQSIDYQKHILTLAYVQERGPQQLIWKSDTEFLRDWKTVPATELKQGTQATVYYPSPFFGRPFVAKVIWDNGD